MLRRLTVLTAAALCAGCTAAGTPAPGAASQPAAAPAPVVAAPPPPAQSGPPPAFKPPSKNPAAVPTGTYTVEPFHTQVLFSVMHFGITPFAGDFSGASGTLKIDARHPAQDQLDVSVPVASVHTTSARLTEELKSAQWLDANAYPAMTFHSTKVVPTGKTSAEVTGNLTLHGVTRPVTMHATFVAAGINPMMHALNVGFTVTGIIKRSEFGVSAAIPMVSDSTKITIAAAFKQ